MFRVTIAASKQRGFAGDVIVKNDPCPPFAAKSKKTYAREKSACAIVCTSGALCFHSLQPPSPPLKHTHTQTHTPLTDYWEL